MIYVKNNVGNVLWFCLVFAAGLVSGCKENTDTANPMDSAGTDEADAGEDAGMVSKCAPANATVAHADATDLFGIDHVPTFEIYLDPEVWAALQENARDEEYTSAEVCFEGHSLGTVGLRFKGAVGSLANCFTASGENVCRKLGMKLKFDEYVDGNRFYGLKRLNFQGNRFDDSYMKERLAYDLYSAMGITAPRASWADVWVNDERMGLYGMVEQVDGRFTTDRWPDNPDQNLYKEAWPVQTDESWVISKLKTNEEVADVSAFVAFAEAMNAAETAELRSTLGRYSDLDYWARYMAVDDAIANYDGITAYYASEDMSWSGNHNFYLYEEAVDHFTIIPWDLESTFAIGNFGSVPLWNQPPGDCDVTYSAWGIEESRVIAPGCDPVFKALAQDLEPYSRAGETLLDGPFAVETMHSVIDDHAAFIRESAEADPNGPGLTAFESAVSTLKNQIPKLRERLSYLLAGETWVPFEIDPDALTDMETQDELGLIMGPQLYINPNSTASFSLNTNTPMVGDQNLVIAFEFQDEEKEWDQWLNYIVPLKGGAKDVTELTGIRMWVRADENRDLRLELDNPYASSVNGWLREGWYIPATTLPAQVEVLFQDADIPAWAYDQGLAPVADLSDILTQIKGLLFSPQCLGRTDDGFLPEDTTDEGFIEIDDIEFF